MINARDAAALYVDPPYTEDQVDELIRSAATRGNCTVFSKQRLTEDMQHKLAIRGFKVSDAATQWFVSWEDAQ